MEAWRDQKRGLRDVSEPPPLGLDLAYLSWCPGDAGGGREVVGKGPASEADDGGEPGGGC